MSIALPAEGSRRAAYKAYVRALALARFRVGSLLAIVLVPAGAVLELATRPDLLRPFLPIRLLVALFALALWALSRVPFLGKRASLLFMVLTSMLTAGIESLVIRGPAPSYYVGLIVVIFVAGLMFPWAWWEMAVAAAFTLAIHVAPVVVGLVPRDGSFTSAYFIFNVGVIAAIASHLGTRAREREFFANLDLASRSEDLRRTSAQLEEALAAQKELTRQKSTFFANVSHELRTPLALILPPLEAMLREPEVPLSTAMRADLEVMQVNADRLLTLINRLLDLARMDAGKLELCIEPVDLASFVTSLVSQFRAVAQRRGISLEATTQVMAPIAADPEHIETVLRNLLSNAIKFTTTGRVAVRCLPQGDAAVVEVTDTGSGIAAEQLPRLFERFSRMDGSPAGGTGLGLALSRELARLHQGDLTVESVAGHGSTFRLRLPRLIPPPAGEPRSRSMAPVAHDAELAQLDVVAAGAETGPEGLERIMVVEDHTELRRFLVRFLSRQFRVVEATGGAEALEGAKRDPPALIVADVMMPGISGVDLLHRLRADPATASVPVILLTALRGGDAVVKGLAAGATDYVAKPFSPYELLARIRVQLRLRHLSRELVKAQKMGLLTTLAGGLAHEIRNPLNAILNGLPSIRDGLASTAEGPQSLDLLTIVQDSAQRIARLVTDFARFANLEGLQRDPWRPSKHIDAVLGQFKHRLKETDVVRSFEFDEAVMAFGGTLDQLVSNLFDNALRAMKGSGRLRIATRKAGTCLELEVWDSGPGIPANVLPRLFDAFFTTRPAGEGTGLGLYLVKQIADTHGGTVSARNHPEGGAVFSVRLPCA